MILRVLIFLLINFAALGIGGFFTGNGVSSDWYNELNKAPWTPPGWVFGAAWTAIMICFSIYMAYLWPTFENKKIILALFILQWVLNVMWNPTFFYFNNPSLALVSIVGLTLLMGYYLWFSFPVLNIKSFLVLPYFIWLIIATSLNLYIVLNN